MNIQKKYEKSYDSNSKNTKKTFTFTLKSP